MAIGQGTIFTASDVKKQLRESNRNYLGYNLWSQNQAYISLQEQLGTEQLSSQYQSAVGQAYMASLGQKQAILGSNMGQGFKTQALSELDTALDDAYISYQQNYLSGLNKVQQEANTARTEVDSLLTEYGTNMANYGNAHLSYLNWLYEKNPEAFNIAADELNTLAPIGMTTLQNEDGETVMRPLGELTSLVFAKDGSLTPYGIDLFKAIESTGATRPGTSFGDYLIETDRDLFDWATSYDPYNFNTEGTNAGSFAEPIADEYAKGVTDNWQFEDYVISDESISAIKGSKTYDDERKHADTVLEQWEEIIERNVKRIQALVNDGKINKEQAQTLLKEQFKRLISSQKELAKLTQHSASEEPEEPVLYDLRR